MFQYYTYKSTFFIDKTVVSNRKKFVIFQTLYFFKLYPIFKLIEMYNKKNNIIKGIEIYWKYALLFHQKTR